MRPSAIRHKSIANRRATATIAFLRAAALLLLSWSTGPQRRNATYCGWKRTIRHASSTIIRRKRGLPCLVIAPKRRLSPLVLQNPKLIYAILFRSVAETLLTIARDPHRLGANLGFLAVLHTWSQKMLQNHHS